MSGRSRFQKVFKAYDIRGTVPDELDVPMAFAVGSAFARFVREHDGGNPGRVVVGRDMRESGVALSRALEEGVMSTGLGVVDVGLASTDLLYFASGHLGLPGAMLTASHNPARYNGIKLCLSGARPIGQESGLIEIRSLAEETYGKTEGSPSGAGGGGAGAPSGAGSEAPSSSGRYERIDLLGEFASHVKAFLPGELRHLKVVADTANGMGGLIAPKVFENLPVELEILYPDLDGSFPNHPADPIQIENLTDLRRRIVETGADVGLAFDGDADRVFLVDERAEPLSGSLTTAIVAAAMLESNPGATILYNLICSKAVPEVVKERGGVPIRTRVGHSFIKARMAETGAVFGGEHSGHYYFKDNFRADSGIIAAMVTLGVMSRSGEALSEIRRPFERYADSGEINTEVRDSSRVLDGVEESFAPKASSIDKLDGLTVDMGDWWFNLRPSNTEPLLRLNLEAGDGESCAAHVAEVLALVTALDAKPAEGGE